MDDSLPAPRLRCRNLSPVLGALDFDTRRRSLEVTDEQTTRLRGRHAAEEAELHAYRLGCWPMLGEPAEDLRTLVRVERILLASWNITLPRKTLERLKLSLEA